MGIKNDAEYYYFNYTSYRVVKLFYSQKLYVIWGTAWSIPIDFDFCFFGWTRVTHS